MEGGGRPATLTYPSERYRFAASGQHPANASASVVLYATDDRL